MKGARARGFTLLEVLVALSIIATALVSLLGLHARNIQVAAHDQNLARATLLAQDLLTRTLLEEPFPDPGELAGRFEDEPTFQWELTVVEGATPELRDELREVDLRVFWDRDATDGVRLLTHVRRPSE